MDPDMKFASYFELGHPVRMITGILGILFFMVLSQLRPNEKYISLVFVFMGLVGLMRDLQKRRQAELGSGQIEQ